MTKVLYIMLFLCVFLSSSLSARPDSGGGGGVGGSGFSAASGASGGGRPTGIDPYQDCLRAKQTELIAFQSNLSCLQWPHASDFSIEHNTAKPTTYEGCVAAIDKAVQLRAAQNVEECKKTAWTSGGDGGLSSNGLPEPDGTSRVLETGSEPDIARRHFLTNPNDPAFTGNPATAQPATNAQTKDINAHKETTIPNTPTGDVNTTSNCMDPETARAQVTQDIASCQGLQNTAMKCCGDPTSCGTPQDLTELAKIRAQANDPGISCDAMRRLGEQTTSLNISFSSICTNDQMFCQTTCSAAATKYSNLAVSCTTNAETRAVYQSAISSLNSFSGSCSSLSAKGDAMGMAGLLATRNQVAGANCANDGMASGVTQSIESLASALTAPTTHPQVQNSDPYGCSYNPNGPACQTCSQNPGAPGCRALSNGNSQAPSQSVGFVDGNKLDQAPIAPRMVSGINMNDLETTNVDLGANSKTNPTATIPNNSPNGAVSAGSDSKLQPLDPKGGGIGDARKNARGGSAGDSFDQGFRSGGGYSPDPSRNVANDGSGLPVYGRSRFGSSSTFGNGSGSPQVGTDLKKYLPGATLDPNRVAGFDPIHSNEINGKGANLFKHVTEKMTERCKLGLLYRCDDP